MTKLKNHPYADLFPMMTGAELEALAADIQENGLLQRIVRYQGTILDGRNRLLACERADVDPQFTDFEGDDAAALSLVISLNVQRRDLTAAQRAIVAARALPLFEAAGEARMKTGKSVDGEAGGRGKAKPSERTVQRVSSRESAGIIFKVGVNAVQQAKALLAEAPDLATQVESCALSLAAAYDQLQQRRKEARQKERDAERVAEYKDAISNGEITQEEAIQQAMEEARKVKEDEDAEASARRFWLEGFAEHLAWFEQFLSDLTDEYLASYTEPGSPGLFDHGITADRIAAVVVNLERTRLITFGETRNGSTPAPQSAARGKAGRP